MNIVRNIGILIGLAVLSFLIGFTVLGKILPSNSTSQKPDPQVAMNNVVSHPVKDAPANNAIVAETPSLPKRTVAPLAIAPSNVDPKANKTNELDKGPVLDAAAEIKTGVVATDTQKPRKLDAELPKTTIAVNDGGVIEQRPATTRRHKRRKHAVPAPELQNAEVASNAGNGDVNPDSAPDTSSSDASETKKSSLYRVHLGSYHTREAASKQMEIAKDKGFDTQVLPVTRRGRTTYRVQLGAYKDKERADGEKQRLNEAGLDGQVAGKD